MGQDYRHLSLDERCEIARLQAEGRSIRQIAAALDRAPSSIARELKRNTISSRNGYKPSQATDQARARRWKGSKLERKPELLEAVLTGLRLGLSPEQVAGRMALEQGRTIISHETIYRFLYAQIARTKNYGWRLYMPLARTKRGIRRRKRGSSAEFIQDRISITCRPEVANDRATPGHWEADLMLFSKYGQAILTLHERTSRLLIGQRPASKSAAPIAASIKSLLEPLPQAMRQTITFDNGTEFARHTALHEINMQTFFCDTYSPWQKGGVENAILRLRRFLHRKTDLARLSDQQFNAIIALYNNTPRKCLDFQTPAEVFSQQLLHFKCESTFPRARE
jgi:IS30 family transposase